MPNVITTPEIGYLNYLGATIMLMIFQIAMISLAIIHNDTPYMNTTNRDQNISMSSCYGGTTYHIVNILL